MSEAEKKWDKWDNIQYPYSDEATKRSREAYKAALRREIEKRIGINDYKAALRREIEKRIGINDYKAALRESIEGVRQKAFSTNGYFHNGMVASDDFIHGWMAARNEFLELLDTVEPHD